MRLLRLRRGTESVTANAEPAVLHAMALFSVACVCGWRTKFVFRQAASTHPDSRVTCIYKIYKNWRSSKKDTMHRTKGVLSLAGCRFIYATTHDAPGRRRKACVRKVPSTPEEGLSGLVVVSTKIDAICLAWPGRAVFSSSGSGSIVHAHARCCARGMAVQLCACSSIQPPHWMPDGAKPYCSHCLEDFDALNRRHPT